MMDDLPQSVDPRKLADHGVSVRRVRTTGPAPTRGHRSFPKTNFDSEPAHRGARRFADPEPEQQHEPDRGSFDDSGAPHIKNWRYQETFYPSLYEAIRSKPWPEPASDFWLVAEARSRVPTIEMESELPKRITPEPVPTSSSPFSPEPTDGNTGNEEEIVPVRATRPDFLGRPKGIGLMILAEILILVLGFMAWSRITRDTWEFTSLWPLGASTSPEKSGSSVPVPSASPDPESTAGARPATSEQTLNNTRSTVPMGWRECNEDWPSARPNRKVVRPQHSKTDIRLQVTSLVGIPERKDLLEACKVLSTNQQKRFSALASTPASQDKINQTQDGSYATCGFTGVRTENQVPGTIMFTVLTRTNDGYVLIPCNIIPDSVGGGATARQELASMSCTASLNFGIALPLC